MSSLTDLLALLRCTHIWPSCFVLCQSNAAGLHSHCFKRNHALAQIPPVSMSSLLLIWSLFALIQRTHICRFIDYARWKLIFVGTAGDEGGFQLYYHCIHMLLLVCEQPDHAKAHLFQLYQG